MLLLGLVSLIFALWDPGWFRERWKLSIRGFVYLHQAFQIQLNVHGDLAKVLMSSLAFTGPLADLTTLLALTSLSISLIHYYYDSQIFRFSRPEFRDGVLPLIAPSRNSKP